MREIPISELKLIVDRLSEQHPMARIDFVFPKRHGGKVRGELGQITTYGVMLDSTRRENAIVRFYLNHARDQKYDDTQQLAGPSYADLEPAINAYVSGEISAGRMRECFYAWQRGEKYELPPSALTSAN